jgi:Spy/CpxP family protein refolding chaperone
MKRFSITNCLIVLAVASLLHTDSLFAQIRGKFGGGQKNRGQQRLRPGDVQGRRPIPPRFKRNPVPLGDNPNLNNRPNMNPAVNALQKQRQRLLMEALNLTPDQRMRVMEIRRLHDDDAIAAGRRLRQARNALDRALMSETYSEALIKEYAEELAAAQAEQIRVNTRVRAEFRKTLTPDQVRRYIEKEREIQEQMRQLKRDELLNQPNRPPNQQQPPDRDGLDMLELFR